MEFTLIQPESGLVIAASQFQVRNAVNPSHESTTATLHTSPLGHADTGAPFSMISDATNARTNFTAR
jgi:hypothetical protein